MRATSRSPCSRTYVGILALACVGISACDTPSASPLSPGSVSTAVSKPVEATLTGVVVLSAAGDGKARVPGARVTVDGVTYTSDANGLASLPAGTVNAERQIDIAAAGFLPRHTMIGGASSPAYVSLWPVANDAEADDVRRMVYTRGHPAGEVFDPTIRGEVIRLKMPAGMSPGDLAVWADIAREFAVRFELAYSFDPQTYGDIYTVAVTVGTPCGGIADLCVGPYEYATRTQPVAVARDRLGDSATVRRAVAAWFLGPHVLPGLMSTTSPRDELSAFEAQTITVMLHHGRRTRWPDDDR